MLTYVTLLKITICSAIFVIYYYAVLRNKVYHQYNRFYLLFGVAFSWCLPFVNFQIFIEPQQTVQPVYKVIEFFTTSNIARPIQQNMPQSAAITAKNINLDIIVSTVFVLISVSLFVKFIYGLYVIFKLKQTNNKQSFSNINVYFTNEPNTPFSFLNSIFWNNNIDIESAVGKQVLAHELVHINQKHSYDKIAMQLCLIAGWFNPFFWILNKELGMIHEFIADKKSIPNANKAQFAQMLLSTNFVTKSPTFSNPFFLSPIKRRLNMLTKNKLPKFSYAQRILALPIFMVVVVAFSLKAQGYNLKQVATNVVNKISNQSTNQNNQNKDIKVADTILIIKNSSPLQDTIKPVKDTIKVNSDAIGATVDELNEYKSYEKVAFTGSEENDKKYDESKLSKDQKWKMHLIYNKMNLKQKNEIKLHSSFHDFLYIKEKPTNDLIKIWKEKKNYSFSLDNRDIDASAILDASEYAGYLKTYQNYNPNDESKCLVKINFTSNERAPKIYNQHYFSWVNTNTLADEKNKTTLEELNELLGLAVKYNPLVPGSNFEEVDRNRAMEIFFKLSDKQKEKSPITFKKILPFGNQDSIYRMEIKDWQGF